jgi:hypothetical protein
MADSTGPPEAPEAMTDYEYSPAYQRDAVLDNLLPGNHTAPPAPPDSMDDGPMSESPGAFFWTVGLNLAMLVAATYIMFVLREKPRTWARRIFFPRLVQVHARPSLTHRERERERERESAHLRSRLTSASLASTVRTLHGAHRVPAWGEAPYMSNALLRVHARSTNRHLRPFTLTPHRTTDLLQRRAASLSQTPNPNPPQARIVAVASCGDCTGCAETPQFVRIDAGAHPPVSGLYRIGK